MAIVRTGGGVRLPSLDGGADGSLDATEDEEESRATPSQESEAEAFSGGNEEDGSRGQEDGMEGDAEEEEDSGMGSDELDITELGEAGVEMCQVGDQSFAVPLELYDLSSLGDVLSLDAWNSLLGEEERLRLATLLPDTDQEAFARTLVELLKGDNFHFGSPLAALFDKLKGGLCDLRIVLYCRGACFAERRKHCYLLQNYHNSMVRGLWEVKDCWKGCEGYSLDERLRMLDAVKVQRQKRKALAGRTALEADPESRESRELFLIWKPDKAELRKAGRLAKDRSLLLGMSTGMDEEGAGHDDVAAFSESSHRNYPYGYDPALTHRGKHRRSTDGLYTEDPGYDRDLTRFRSSRLLPKPGKKELVMGYDGNLYGNNHRDNHMGAPYYYGRPMGNQGVTLAAPVDPPYFDTRRNARYSERDWVQGGKGVQGKAQRGDEMHWPAGTNTAGLDEWQEGQAAGDYRSRKAQAGHGLKVKSYRSIEQQDNDPHLRADPRDKISQKMKSKSSSRFDEIGQKHHRSVASYAQSEETESDSLEWFEDGADAEFLGQKSEHHYSGSNRPGYGSKKSNKLAKAVKMTYPGATTDFNPSQSKGIKGKVSETGYSRDLHATISEMVKPPSANGERKRKGMSNLGMHGYDTSALHEIEENNKSFRSMEDEMLAIRLGHAVEDSNDDFSGTEQVPLKSCSSGSKKTKGVEHAPSGPKAVENSGNSKKKSKKKQEAITDAVTVAEPAATVSENDVITVEPEKPEKPKKYVPITPSIHTSFSFSVVHLLTAVKKTMINPTENIPAAAKQPDGEEGKTWFNNEEQNKAHQESGAAEQGQPALQVSNATAAASTAIEQVQPVPEVANATAAAPNSTEQAQQPPEVTVVNAAEQTAPSSSPALTVRELVNRIKLNPGDPRILETQEPLQDLVRGVLKVLSSRTAPLGAKGWRPLVAYEKSNKSWFWVGPVTSVSFDDPDEETSAEAWGIPHKMLVKLVDAFSNWLKSGQETLKQIGSLPPPPPPNPANLDLKERFKELRAQKSLNTIIPSSDEAKAYFQREEFLRYSIPDRAFCYTAADGEKSIVAPLRRGGGKPTAKARGHPMLLPDRPPHVTILCLVRDAAARLPATTGTRADVCTLLRDSQYLNCEEVNKEVAINQVVSGALDRLHYERDPCVLYDNDKKLWTYLHRGREEEDFEDDGTSSTKKWKRPRKDPSDPADPGAGNDDSEDDGAGTPSTNGVKKQKTDHADPTVSGEAKDAGDHPTQNASASGFSGGLEANINVKSDGGGPVLQ
jgi:nuclear factor related to kappa-B-binding protein